LFVDGDRGGKLIARNVVDNAKIKYIAMAPDGKEVEELTGKEILMNLRKKISVSEFFSRERVQTRSFERESPSEKAEKIEVTEGIKSKLKELSSQNQGKGKAILLDSSLSEIKKVSAKSLNNTLRRIRPKPSVIVIDDIVTASTIKSAEEINCQIIVAKNFGTTETNIKLLYKMDGKYRLRARAMHPMPSIIQR